jgi:Domain of unknown function (DUF4149)
VLRRPCNQRHTGVGVGRLYHSLVFARNWRLHFLVTLIRFLMLITLIVWIGGIVFFSVLAPVSFSVLPTRHLAGALVGSMLSKLHWVGLGAGLVFLFASVTYSCSQTGMVRVFTLPHLLICVMLILTLISQFAVLPKMAALRTSIGEIDSVPPNNPLRVHFNALHLWSTRLEAGVLLLGLVVVYLTSRQML